MISCVFYLFISVLQTVSYAQFLLPTNALVKQKSNMPLDTSTVQALMSRNRISSQKNFCHQRFCSAVGQEAGAFLRHWNSITTTFTVVMVSFDVFYISFRNRCGRVVRLQPQPVEWSTVAVWEAQEGLNLWLLCGERFHFAALAHV